MPEKDDQWRLVFCAGFIVEPSKGLQNADVEKRLKGSRVEIDALPRDFFLSLFQKPSCEYPIEIAFVSEGDGQWNSVRDLVRSILFGKTNEKETSARQLALRLALATDERSPPGLFVVLAGQTDDDHRIVLWKFPADQTLQADIMEGAIKIRLIEDAFSRESTYFKAALIEGRDTKRSLWKGKVEDRQAKHLVKGVAEFWTAGFLMASPVFTDAHGTRVMAKALKDAINANQGLEAKESIVAAARVLRTQGDRNISIGQVAADYLPKEMRGDFIASAGGPGIADDVFRLVPETLEREFRVKSITLDGKFVVRGPLDEFDDAVTVVPTPEEGIVGVSLKGKITSESLSAR